jgi:hypothetical protein
MGYYSDEDLQFMEQSFWEGIGLFTSIMVIVIPIIIALVVVMWILASSGSASFGSVEVF